MTPNEIKARCCTWLVRNGLTDCDGVTGTVIDVDLLQATESLCREMLANGIKVACGAMSKEFLTIVAECEKEADMLKDGAQLKEPPCDISS